MNNANQPIPAVPVPRPFLEAILENLYELAGEKSWWENEPRCGYHARYLELRELIKETEEALRVKTTSKP